ncbi:hypothetical protein [Phosphitispora fastidiosa]|uniref:hypothetical protein n=1 Tax=Phosphitispora fastidiosa TaxID=2837202 RepID=UPI001E41356B|nr:hypothetical protein [Phosphitispora fastidiosa]MBU7006558.1 hypothetical protein [Phosphitispora fastidiosa]
MKKAESMMKKVLCLLLAVLMMGAFTGCGDDNKETSGSGSMQDPYAAYGLEREKSYNEGNTLMNAMMEKQPAAIHLQPVFYYRTYYEPIPQSGDITLERGKSANISLDLELVPETGEKCNIKSNITLKYDGKKGEDLFHADTSTYGNPTLYKDGIYVREYGDHVVKNKTVRMEYISAGGGFKYEFIGVPEELLYVPLYVDKGEATKADGNIGILYFRIKGVQR